MSEIQALISIKIVALVFVAGAIFLLSKKTKSIYFLWLVGVASALAYFFLVNNQALLLWGLQGDELTIAAMYESFAHSSFWSDFAFRDLPPFYPPAWFWLFALPGRIFDWNGIQLAKLATFSFLLFFPVLVYYLLVLFRRGKDADENGGGRISSFLAPLLIITILDKDLLIGKPYEVLAGVATIYWVVAVYADVSRSEWSWKRTLFYGLTAGLIFMTYYLWLVFAAIVFTLLGLEIPRGGEWSYYKRLLLIVPVAILASLPFLGPLILSYANHGTENWQVAFFIPDGLDLWLPMFANLSLNNLVLLGGLFVLIFYRQNKFIKPLLYFVLAAFAWWLMGLVTLYFGAPFQEFRGFYLLAPLSLAIGAAFGIERLWLKYGIDAKENWRVTLGVIGILFFVSQSIFGLFVDDYRRHNEKNPLPKISAEARGVIDYIAADAKAADRLTLHTMPQIMAFTSLNSLIYFNQHNSHPAANFSQRFYLVKSMAAARTSEELRNIAAESPFGKIERFIFFSDKDYYYLYFHLDKFGAGIRTEEVKFSKKLFAEKYFEEVFEKDGYVILNLK